MIDDNSLNAYKHRQTIFFKKVDEVEHSILKLKIV